MAGDDANDLRRRLDRIRQTLSEDQQGAAALAEMGEILMMKGLWSRATQFLAHAVQLEPNNPRFRELYTQALERGRGSPSSS